MLLLVLFISGCGGGGGDGGDGDSDTTEKIEISGAILVPGGAVTDANPIGLKGAANKPVSLYRIDDTGLIIGDVLDTTTSDQNGNYVLLLPADIEYASDIVVEAIVEPATGPKPAVTARAIVLDETTDVTPITEYITEKLINAVPKLDMSALPLEEVVKLVAFVESLPLSPLSNFSDMVAEIETVADIVVDAQIDDINDGNQQVRLSGLLSAPGGPGTPRPAPGTAAKSIPVGNNVVELYKIDANGNNILPKIETIPAIVTTNADGVFTLQLPPDTDLSGELRLQAIVNTVTIWALATAEIININAESHYIATKLLAEPNVVPSSLNVDEVLGIIQFINTANCPEATDLAAQINEFENCVGAEIDQQVDNAVNDPPTGSTLNVAAIEDITRGFDISPNVTDSDGSVVLSTTTVVSGPTNGVLVNNFNGTFTYTGFLNYVGPDAFTYTVADNDGLVSAAAISVSIDVATDNDAPTGTTRDAFATEEILLVINISGDVNDVDGTVDLSTTAITTSATNGSLVNNGDGTFNYTGNPDFADIDGFTYTVMDDLGQISADITVNIDVSNVNDAPRGSTLATSAIEEADTAIDIRGNVSDVDGSVVFSSTAISEFPSNGNLANNGDGTFTYTGILDFVGLDGFLFIVDDNDGLPSAPISVSIDVIADNDAPTGTTLNLNADEETATPIDIRASVNDVDSPVDFGTTTVTGGPSSGTLLNIADGTFTYTGNLDFVGADAFTYTVADDGGQVSDNITVNVIVDNLNDAPRGTTLLVNADEETLAAFIINSNVADIDGTVDFTTTAITTPPDNGILVNIGSGSFTYTGDLDFVGTDSFTYTVADDLGLPSADITVTLNVGFVNDPPTGTTLDADANEETPTLIDISGNVGDVDGSVVLSTTAIVDLPGNGDLVNNANGTFTYTGSLNFVGVDSFTYTVNDDGDLTSANITVNVAVANINDPPTGTTLVVAALEETTVVFNINSNVSDLDGSVVPSTTTVTGGPGNGILVNNGDGSFDYTGNLDFISSDAFTYTVEDNDGLVSANIGVTINVANVNDAPTGTNTFTLDAVEETATLIDISSDVSDVDGTVVLATTTVTGGPNNGNLADTSNGTFSYTGNLNYVGSDGFTYTVEDNNGQVSANISVTINVTSDNDVPTGSTLVVAAVEEVLRVIDISGNVSDVDGTVNLATTTVTGGPSNGNLVNIGNGSFTYTGDLDFSDVDNFTYTVADNEGGVSADIGVTINVANDNDAPRAINPDLQLEAVEETATPIDITANIFDVDGTVDFNTTLVTSGPSDGNLIDNGDGTFIYTGNPDFFGSDSFTYTVADDGPQTSAIFTVTINVNNLNDPPTGTTLIVEADEETATAIDITGNVIDSDGTVDFGTTVVTGGPANGNLVNNGDGTFTYSGDVDYFGADAFTYTVMDNNIAVSANISVAINVNDTNDTSPVVDAAGPFDLPENSGNDTTIITLTASDSDTTGETLVFSIDLGNTGGAFGIIPGDNLAVANFTALDYESPIQSFTLTVTAFDGVNISLGKEIVINLTDVNDNPPEVEPDQVFGLSSTALNETVVGTVVATDADDPLQTGGITSFGIASGDPGGIFRIEVDGRIIVTDRTNLADGTYNLFVTADDADFTSTPELVEISVTSNIGAGVWDSGDQWDDGSQWQ